MNPDFHYLDELNPVQKQAAITTEGPVMIIAGAGSGKTRVLTYRIAHIIEKGVDPFNILALTFTNKAAREMKSRIGKLIGENKAKALWMGTFHSIFAKILRFEAEKLGYPSNFTIYDTDDSKNVIKEVLKQMNLDDKIYKPSLVLNRISSAKNNLISPKQYLNNSTIQTEDRNSQKPLMGLVYEAYAKRCFKAGAMDFDDLLFNTNILMRDHPSVLLKYQDKFRYILVDEYQDTNFSQYVIVKQLAARFENICVVGDDAQSIYAFRGANIQNILNFKKDYPDLKTFKLEQNYRSTQTIVKVASSVISNNKDQFEKNIFTENEIGEKIKIVRANTDNEEGMKVANSIFETKLREQAFNSNFAILYRTNAQSRSLEEALRKLNIPYKIYGGVSFYQRKEIKDLLAYFRLSINQNDDESLKRIINYPTRGIGNTTIEKLDLTAAEHNISIFTVCENLKDFGLGINTGTANKINDFVTMIKLFSLQLHLKDAFELGNSIAANTGLLKDLYTDKTPEGLSRYENIQELLNGLKDFVEQARTPQEQELKDAIVDGLDQAPDNTDLFAEVETETPSSKLKTLDEFMQDITLMTDVDKEEEKGGNDKDKVSLMTIHAAKGLEFPYVYIVGLEENLFPSQMSVNSRADLEEERRLFYVAITRAEKRATLTYATTRYRFGNILYCEPSRFLDELDADYVEYPEEPITNAFKGDVFDKLRDNYFDEHPKEITFKNKFAPKTKPTTGTSKPAITPSNPQTGKKLISVNVQKPSPPSIGVDAEVLKRITVGTILEHERFGKGRVELLEGEYPNIKATVQFSVGGAKQLLLKFAKVKIVE
ncbi:MAG: 3'-5' exonuclease [Bacteroidota bacterium]|nr:3'-5' exonuclease [Bacteroidota bacterium]